MAAQVTSRSRVTHPCRANSSRRSQTKAEANIKSMYFPYSAVRFASSFLNYMQNGFNFLPPYSCQRFLRFACGYLCIDRACALFPFTIHQSLATMVAALPRCVLCALPWYVVPFGRAEWIGGSLIAGGNSLQPALPPVKKSGLLSDLSFPARSALFRGRLFLHVPMLPKPAHGVRQRLPRRRLR